MYFTLQFEKLSYTVARKSWRLEAEESDHIGSIWMNFCNQLDFFLCGPGLIPEDGTPSFRSVFPPQLA